MPRFAQLFLTIVILTAYLSESHARGIGVRSFLVSKDGVLITELGETANDLLDPAAFVIYRVRAGRVVAAPLDKPDETLWSAEATPRRSGRHFVWRLYPQFVLVVGEDSLTAIEAATGKLRYTTPTGRFTENLALLKYGDALEAEPWLYMIDDHARREHSPLDKKPVVPAMLARFDLRSGKFLWKTALVTAAGEQLQPQEIDPRGIVLGSDDQEFYFDPATGKALEKPVPLALAGKTSAPRGPHVKATDEQLEYVDAAGQTVWTRRDNAVKGPALMTADSIVIPYTNERMTSQLVAFNIKDGSERWRCQIPLGTFADSIDAKVQPAKRGYLVQLHWIVLD